MLENGEIDEQLCEELWDEFQDFLCSEEYEERDANISDASMYKVECERFNFDTPIKCSLDTDITDYL